MTTSGMPAVFLDKDGTLIENVPYNVDPSLVRFMPEAGAALRALSHAGYALVVVTNQSGVARGYFDPTTVDAVRDELAAQFAREQVVLDGWYCCPHLPNGAVPAFAIECGCRKPAPGLLLQAADELDIDLHRSWMVGDILDDIEAGNRAGCKTVLVDVGNESEWRSGPHRAPTYRATNLLEAAQFIVAASEPFTTASKSRGAR